MIRKTMLLCLVAATAGCLRPTGPLTYVASIPTPREGAFSCAFRAVNEMGFTVTNADQGAGFISAEKATALGTNARSEFVYHDRLTVAIFEAGDATRTLRVTAMHAPQTAERSAHAARRGPSSHGTAAARILMQACAPGTTPVQQHAGAAFQLQAPVAE